MNKCEYCFKEFEGPAVAKPAGGRLLIFCSRKCRLDYTNAVTRPRLSGPGEAKTKGRLKQLNRATAAEKRKISNAREGDISKAAAKELDNAGIWNTRLQSGSVELKAGHYMKLCREGTPDRMFADGLVVFLEIKSTGKQPGPEQVAAIAELKHNGALAFVVDDYLQLDFIRRELSRNRPRILKVRDEIAAIQKEIEDRFNAKFRPTNQPGGDAG